MAKLNIHKLKSARYTIKYVIIFAIKLYQICISPLLPKNCRYNPTCSQYTIIAVKKYGIIQGLSLGATRIFSCHPFSNYGDDPVPEIYLKRNVINMDTQRLVIFILISILLLFAWDKYIDPQINPKTNQIMQYEQSLSNNDITTSVNNNTNNKNNNDVQNINKINQPAVINKTISITTNNIQATVNSIGGDISALNLLKYGKQDNPKQPYSLLNTQDNQTFNAQTGLIMNNIALVNHNTAFTASNDNYVMLPQDKTLTVNLSASYNNIDIVKSYTFNKNNYIINIAYHITNNSNNDINNLTAYWQLLRDDTTPDGEMKFVHTYTGAAYYDNDDKFTKLSFDDIKKNNNNYPEYISNGWVGFIQHYFTVMWLLNSYQYNNVCNNQVKCRLNFKPINNNLYSAGVLTDLPTIKAHNSYDISMPIFAGPQENIALQTTAPELERTKDYGWVYIFATPLFWLLIKLFNLLHNWGYAIIALTVIVKCILYPLTRTSYISMAKMKTLAPKMEKIKIQFKDDKVKLQQAIMGLYKTEKVNPIGGCLPMILQIPIFIGLYWALLSSVELRQASFLWVKDLSAADPYYILPAILAITMFIQTFMSPPPADPVQAKMMRIMPALFSIMFFFFPAGLVVYWLINNILSILQQWYVNKHVVLKK